MTINSYECFQRLNPSLADLIQKNTVPTETVFTEKSFKEFKIKKKQKWKWKWNQSLSYFLTIQIIG